MTRSHAITHQQLLSQLTPQERKKFQQRSNLRGLRHLSGHLALLAGLGLPIAWQLPLWQILLLPYGITLNFLFTLLHETTHDTPFRSHWLNGAVGAVCGFVIFVPSRWFRAFHLAHHRYTHIPNKDPELQAKKPHNLPSYLIHLSGLLTWKSHWLTLCRNALILPASDFIPSKKRPLIQREARTHLILYALMIAASFAVGGALVSALIWLWLVPLLLGQPFLRGYLLAEHTLCPHVSNMLHNTRTTITMRVVRFIAWNMPYHNAHHINPLIPFHQLPHFHQLIAPHLTQTAPGYLAFQRQLLNKLEA